MSKKKTTKKKLINGVDEEAFLSALDNITKRLGNKFKFGYHTYEDMKQQAAIFAIEGLDKYDSSRPLENFLWTHVRNRLFNYKRDNYQRPDKPCLTCPFYDKHYSQSNNQCTEFSNIEECSLYTSWASRNIAKKNIMKPVSINDLDFNITDSKSPTEHQALKKQIFELIEQKLPTKFRETYLRFKHGEKIPKQQQENLVQAIQQILKGVKKDD